MIIPVFKLFLSDYPLCLLLHVCHVISDPLYLHFEAVQRPRGHVFPLSVSQHVPGEGHVGADPEVPFLGVGLLPVDLLFFCPYFLTTHFF